MVQKCEACKTKKISGLFAFSCKCGYKVLCSNCRMSENHSCTYDFRKEGIIELIKQNPKIESNKLDKL